MTTMTLTYNVNESTLFDRRWIAEREAKKLNAEHREKFEVCQEYWVSARILAWSTNGDFLGYVKQ